MTLSNVTLYDSDEMLWYTKIGNQDTIFYTIWGKTQEISRLQAEKLLKMLNENVKEPV